MYNVNVQRIINHIKYFVMEYIIKLPVIQTNLFKMSEITSKELAKNLLKGLKVEKQYNVNLVASYGMCDLYWQNWAVEEAASVGLYNRSKAFVYVAAATAEGSVFNPSLARYQQLYYLIYVPFKSYTYLVTEQTLGVVPVANLLYSIGIGKRKVVNFHLDAKGTADAFRYFTVTSKGDLSVLHDEIVYVKDCKVIRRNLQPMYFAKHTIEDATL